MNRLAVYVPKDGVLVPGLEGREPKGVALVAVASSGTLRLAVCSKATEPGHRDFCFADKVREAAAPLLRQGRPRGVRIIEAPADDYLDVALWDDSQGVVRLLPGRERLLDRWLGSRAYRNDLEASDSAANQRQGARRDMRRALIQGRPDKAARIQREHNLPGW